MKLHCLSNRRFAVVSLLDATGGAQTWGAIKYACRKNGQADTAEKTSANNVRNEAMTMLVRGGGSQVEKASNAPSMVYPTRRKGARLDSEALPIIRPATERLESPLPPHLHLHTAARSCSWIARQSHRPPWHWPACSSQPSKPDRVRLERVWQSLGGSWLGGNREGLTGAFGLGRADNGSQQINQWRNGRGQHGQRLHRCRFIAASFVGLVSRQRHSL